MIGPYYKPQLTSLMSITHRMTGVFLSVVAAPLLLCWIISVSNGAESYQGLQESLSGWLGRLLLLACLFCLSFHFLNGIRHLIWDTGRMLEIRSAYTAGWLVLGGSVLATAIIALLMAGGVS
jgi:succinate dehydrogenase / fumarate reductase cytochrome b subunit